jgi:transposase
VEAETGRLGQAPFAWTQPRREHENQDDPPTGKSPLPPVLYMALELAEATWKLGFTVAFGQRPRLREIPARDTAALVREIEAALCRFGLDATTPVLSCYEAGREGFWVHRFLEHAGVTNLVVDAGSMEVVPGRRRRKTDRLDTGKLLECLIRHREGRGRGRKVWSVVRVPTPEAEDARQLNRELMALRRIALRLTNRMHGLLAGQGARLELGSDFPEQLELLRTSQDESVERVRKLLALRAIGINSAWLFVMEFFDWRELRNRRQVGALAGLVASPFSSGETERELGISKAGNRHIRALAIEIAWCGCASSRRASSRSGTNDASPMAAGAFARSASWLWRGGC